MDIWKLQTDIKRQREACVRGEQILHGATVATHQAGNILIEAVRRALFCIDGTRHYKAAKRPAMQQHSDLASLFGTSKDILRSNMWTDKDDVFVRWDCSGHKSSRLAQIGSLREQRMRKNQDAKSLVDSLPEQQGF